MLAQRYATAYDGMIAGAPAIHWTELFRYIQWPQHLMNELGSYPLACEFDAITVAAVKACDGLDGVLDGVISKVGECLETFDPFTFVGQTIRCPELNGTHVLVTESASAAVNATWQCMSILNGRQAYDGIALGVQLTGTSTNAYGQPGLLSINCISGGYVTAVFLWGCNGFSFLLQRIQTWTWLL
ncbi:hypothetical protein ACHAPU_006212 [Fusarium lateritium]